MVVGSLVKWTFEGVRRSRHEANAPPAGSWNQRLRPLGPRVGASNPASLSPQINKEEEAEVEVSHRHESTPVCVLKVEEGPVTGWTEQLMKSTTFNFLRQLFWQAGEGVGDA